MKNRKCNFVILIFLLFLINTITFSQDYVGKFDFEGVSRTYLVYLPHNYQANMPLILYLHGYQDTPQYQAKYTRLHAYADTAGLIVVYPTGSSKDGNPGWNSGIVDHSWIKSDTTANDLGYLSALIDTIDSKYNIDLGRVYCAGLSMGGEMTYRVASEMGHRIAAIASVAGTPNDIQEKHYRYSHPFPILHFHGTADNIIPYDEDFSYSWSVQRTMDFWIDKNECALPADTVALPDLVPEDSSTVDKITISNCNGNGCFILYKVNNGGHGWPGSALDPGWAQPRNMDIETGSLIVNFFKKYQNPLIDLAFGKNIIIEPGYCTQKGGDFHIYAELTNPEKHAVSVKAYIEGTHSDLKDSLELYNDGLHDDSGANDNNWGNTINLTDIGEDFFDIKLRTIDLDMNYKVDCPFNTQFTSCGPVLLPNEGEIYHELEYNADEKMLTFMMYLHNYGSTTNIPNVTAKLGTMDERVVNLNHDKIHFYNIPPGKTVLCQENICFNVDGISVLTGTTDDPIKFTLDIYTDDKTYWSDTLEFISHLVTDIEQSVPIVPEKFSLEQNYPNPFNPSTTIRYNIVNTSYVELGIYNTNGQLIEMLTSTWQSPGQYAVKWDGSKYSNGIYFCKFKTGDFVDIIKMLYLK